MSYFQKNQDDYDGFEDEDIGLGSDYDVED